MPITACTPPYIPNSLQVILSNCKGKTGNQILIRNAHLRRKLITQFSKPFSNTSSNKHGFVFITLLPGSF